MPGINDAHQSYPLADGKARGISASAKNITGAHRLAGVRSTRMDGVAAGVRYPAGCWQEGFMNERKKRVSARAPGDSVRGVLLCGAPGWRDFGGAFHVKHWLEWLRRRFRRDADPVPGLIGFGFFR